MPSLIQRAKQPLIRYAKPVSKNSQLGLLVQTLSCHSMCCNERQAPGLHCGVNASWCPIAYKVSVGMSGSTCRFFVEQARLIGRSDSRSHAVFASFCLPSGVPSQELFQKAFEFENVCLRFTFAEPSSQMHKTAEADWQYAHAFERGFCSFTPIFCYRVNPVRAMTEKHSGQRLKKSVITIS